MKAKDDVFIFREERIVVQLGQAVGMLVLGCSFIGSTTLITRIFNSGRWCPAAFNAPLQLRILLRGQSQIDPASPCFDRVFQHLSGF